MTAVPSMPAEKSQAASRRSPGVAAEGRSAIARSRSGLGAEADEHRPLDLAVVVRAAHPSPVGGPGRVRADEERRAGRRGAPGGLPDRPRRLAAGLRMGFERGPVDAGRLGLPVEARGHEVPAPLAERSCALRVQLPLTRAETKPEPASLVDLKGEPRFVWLGPPPEHRFAPPDGSGRPDERADREARAVPEPGSVVDPHVRPRVDGLEAAPVLAVHRARCRHEIEPGTPRVGVAAHDPHEVEAVALDVACSSA